MEPWQMEYDMKRLDDRPRTIALHDYGTALRSAVSWLGDRYLLAEPVARRKEEPKPFFTEARHWHQSPRIAVSRRH
jgi:hypothetical protein